ncbi:MAG: 4-(cytidine 5'-diphospho)-2-C-methyl-D-erythritol kinase [Sphingobacteriia bacterium]|nr:MAG: 4-(cytidine 5'-diphospho)-2-C-methyl-D-erythritol kinase [Sphingobacteriia bacterium]TAG30927.1 MAG: 4-(cytidine 5'-diphospho)-2-C-methyl-D-erythritol kinase [Sphingobacteriia bacterium]
MISFPNCKINLGLNIIGKRADGYHDLETVFYPLQLTDALEIIRADATDLSPQSTPVFSTSGLPIPGDQNNNLCIKAYQLLKKDFPALAPIKIHLHKAIPMGAGLGGGSADASFTLQLLNKKFNLNLSEKKQIEYAAELGSDCPFFVINQPSIAKGRGEILSPLTLNLSAYNFVLVHPGIHISTKWAFEQIKPFRQNPPIQEIIETPIQNWKSTLFNDFEAPIAAAFPEINTIKNKLYETGAVYASMSGSGSTVFGIYQKDITHNMHLHFNHRVDQINGHSIA